jgi:hypothetical protein
VSELPEKDISDVVVHCIGQKTFANRLYLTGFGNACDLVAIVIDPGKNHIGNAGN